MTSLESLSEAQQRVLLRAAFADVWACDMGLSVDGHKFELTGREYERAIMRDESPRIVIPKGAQLGLTTVFITRTCHWVTQRKWHHLYCLPLKTGAISFVQARIDTLIDSNPTLRGHFSRTDNRTHKQTIHGANWYVRGTNIATELREIPVDVLVLDERDKMVEENLPEAQARLDGSKIRRVVELSTPTVPGHGVDDEESWGASDQHRWWVKCLHCGRGQVLTFEHNIEPWLEERREDCRCFCQHCRSELTEQDRYEMNAEGWWEPDNPQGRVRGYHISQLNSPTKAIPDFLLNYFLGRKDAKYMRAFYNNNRGLPFVAEGDQFSPELLDHCVDQSLIMGGIPQSTVFVGVDVGSRLHISLKTLDRHGRLCAYGFQILNSFGELENLLDGMADWICVCDAHPEKRKVEELSIKYHGRFWMGFERDAPNQPETASWGATKYGEVSKVTIDRTMAFDNLIHRALNGRYILPSNARLLGENMPRLAFNGFYNAMIQMARVEKEDTNGTIRAFWVKSRRPDHWHHSEMFALVASMQQAPLTVTADVRNLINAGSIFA